MLKVVKQTGAILLIRYGHILVWFQFSRLVFLLMQPTTSGPLVATFLCGLRYDLTTICIINFVPIILTSFQADRVKPLMNLIKWWTFLLNGLALLLNFSDSAWFSYSAQRCNADLLFMAGTGNDLWKNLPVYFSDYWYLGILWIISLISLMKVEGNIASRSISNQLLKSDLALVIIVGLFYSGFAIVGFRGGLQLKPLSVQSAVRFVPHESVPLVINSAFTFIKSVDDPGLEALAFMSPNQSREYYTPYHSSQEETVPSKNLVVIILESMSFDYVGYYSKGTSLTPFLDSLMRVGHTWPNCFANGKRSIDGVPAVIASLPALLPQSFISSGYNINRINSPANLLASAGYRSGFFHGGTNGTMGFDNFASLAGYEYYFGKDQYDGPNTDDDGNWGISDHAFYRFMSRKLSSWPQPFHAAFFSLSSHHPYRIPENYQDGISKQLSPIQRSVAYADISLREFFQQSSGESWFNNTVFVITADHSGPSQSAYTAGKLGAYHIPLIILMPNDTTGKIHPETAQQTDVLPTALHVIGFNKPFAAFGRNLFKSTVGWSISRSESGWQLISDTSIVQFDGEKHAARFLRSDSLMRSPKACNTKSTELLLLKSIVQQFNSAMINNRLTNP